MTVNPTKRSLSGSIAALTLSCILACLSLLAAPTPLRAQATSPDVATIIARHIEARGGSAAIHAVENVIFDQGHYREGDFELTDFVVMLRRPYYKVVGHPARNPEFLEGYDGAAWEWYYPAGFVVHTTGPANRAARHFADIDTPLIDYADKGSRVELIGTETIDGRPAYRVRLTMLDDHIVDFLIDQESYLIVGQQQTMPQHAFGNSLVTLQRFSDYRPVAGVLFPYRNEEVEIATGRVINTLVWGSIRVNEAMPLAWFSPPQYERTPMQQFMEQLFIQRDDPQAVLWTYHNFRRANPGADTREASQIMGYQMLKSEAYPGAIALLTRNAADNPQSAESAFGVGRAYAAAGRREEARRGFQRALELEPGHARATRGLAELGN